MVEQQTRKILGATPRQLVLIGVLAITLVSVLCMQAGGLTAISDGATSPQLGASAAVTPGRRPVAPSASQATEAPARPWPAISLEQSLQHDPFSLPAAMAEAADPRAAEAEQADPPPPAWLKQGVKLVFRDGQTAVATIGTHVVHVGDVFDGYKVVAIDVAGVTLQREPIATNATNK